MRRIVSIDYSHCTREPWETAGEQDRRRSKAPLAAVENTTAVHKELLILGMLGDAGPTSGYDLHRIIRAHGELFSDLKKANMYHLLDRMAREGYLRVRRETGARGRLGEKRLYSLTRAGRRRFELLLTDLVKGYDTVHTGVEVAMVFLRQLRRSSARSLLRARRTAVAERRRAVVAAFGDISARQPFTRIAADHLLSLIDAEAGWLERSLRLL